MTPQPLTGRDELALLARLLTRRIGQFFRDGERPCDGKCGECYLCARATHHQLAMLAQRGTRVWGFWDGPELKVLAYFTDIVPHVEAQFHAFVADGRLLAHTGALQEALVLPGVKRVYAAVPAFRMGLVPYLTKRLGFHFLQRQCRVCRWRGELHKVAVLERRF